MLEKIKNIFLRKKEKKLERLLDIVDDILINDKNVVIKLNKNLIIYSSGHQFFLSEGDIVIKSNFLHLNPDAQIIDDLKCGKGNKALKNIHQQNIKMGQITNEVLEYEKEIIEEENAGEEHCVNCK